MIIWIIFCLEDCPPCNNVYETILRKNEYKNVGGRFCNQDVCIIYLKISRIKRLNDDNMSSLHDLNVFKYPHILAIKLDEVDQINLILKSVENVLKINNIDIKNNGDIFKFFEEISIFSFKNFNKIQNSWEIDILKNIINIVNDLKLYSIKEKSSDTFIQRILSNKINQI